MFPATSKILITDDSNAMRLTIATTLTQLGFSNFTFAENGNEGFAKLEAAGDAPFDLVLSDHNMPECTGLEFLAKVRGSDKFKKLPFVVITSETNKEVIFKLAQGGASNYVAKPLTPETLKAKLEATFIRVSKG